MDDIVDTGKPALPLKYIRDVAALRAELAQQDGEAVNVGLDRVELARADLGGEPERRAHERPSG